MIRNNNNNTNTNQLLRKLETLPSYKQHCSHYSIEQDEPYEWEKDDWCITDLQNVSFENLCNEENIISHVHKNVKCPYCKSELLSCIHKLPNSFYDFDGINIRQKLVSEDSLMIGNVYFNLEYMFTNNGVISLVPDDTHDNIVSSWLPRKLDFSTMSHKVKLLELFGQLEEELKNELTEESILHQDNILYDIIQVLIRYIYVIQKFSNVCVFETTPPIDIHNKIWKMLDLQFAMFYRHLTLCLNELSSHLNLLNIPMTPLLNIHTKEYFENFKSTYGENVELIEKILRTKKKLNTLRLSDIQSFFNFCEKQLSKYEEDFVSFMKRTSSFHDSEEYLGSIHLSGEQSVLFVLFELTFGPLLHKKVAKIPLYSQELHNTELRACQIVISHMTTFTKQRDLLYKIIVPNDFPLLPEYHKEIYDTVKKLDDEWKLYETQCSRQIKHEESCGVMSNYSKRTLEGITLLKCISVLRKLSTFTNFLHESKISLRSIICGSITQPNITYEYLEIIKKQIQFNELHTRCSKESKERIINELLSEYNEVKNTSASNDTKKKSKKKVTKKKEKNMNSPQDPVPDNIEWISKVKQSNSFTSLVSLCEESSSVTTNSSDDDKQWTHVTNTKASKETKETRLKNNAQQKASTTNNKKQKVSSVVNTTTNAPQQTTSTSTSMSTSTVKSGLSFAQILRRQQEPIVVRDVPVVKTSEPVVPVVKDVPAVIINNDVPVVSVVKDVPTVPITKDVPAVPIKNNSDVKVQKKKKNNNKQQTTTHNVVQPPPPLFPPPLPTGRELTAERYLTRIPDYIHIPSYSPEQFHMTHVNSNAPNVPQQPQQVVLVPQVIYVPQMYSTPYHIMYPTMY